MTIDNKVNTTVRERENVFVSESPRSRELISIGMKNKHEYTYTAQYLIFKKQTTIKFSEINIVSISW